MSDQFAEYALFFPEGLRVRVGVPLAAGGSFQEWGDVSSLERDLLRLQLSRDRLPQEARLDLGRTLELRFVRDKISRICRGVVVSAGSGGGLSVRLVEGVAEDEPREYFRHEVFLPVDYNVPRDQNAESVRKRWTEARRMREFAMQQPEPEESKLVREQREELKRRMRKEPAVLPSAANISGGGLRFPIPERLAAKMLVNLIIYLPEPACTLEIVGEVVEVKPLPDGVHFSTALRFRFIDERDRDRIIAFICAEQLEHLRRSGGPPRPLDPFRRRKMGMGLALALLAMALGTGYLVRSVLVSRAHGEKHEIERAFEEGVKRYLRQRE